MTTDNTEMLVKALVDEAISTCEPENACEKASAYTRATLTRKFTAALALQSTAGGGGTFEKDLGDLIERHLGRGTEPAALAQVMMMEGGDKIWDRRHELQTKRECNCGFVGLRHTPACRGYPLTVEGGFPAYPPGGGDEDSDTW